MTHIINVKVKTEKDGRLVVTCKEIPGLFLMGKDHDKVLEDIEPAIQIFLGHNDFVVNATNHD